jgi:hypothetical protein
MNMLEQVKKFTDTEIIDAVSDIIGEVRDEFGDEAHKTLALFLTKYRDRHIDDGVRERVDTLLSIMGHAPPVEVLHSVLDLAMAMAMANGSIENIA